MHSASEEIAFYGTKKLIMLLIRAHYWSYPVLDESNSHSHVILIKNPF
jgi:hypothetical protein